MVKARWMKVLFVLLAFPWIAFAYSIVGATQKADELSAEGRRLYNNIVSLTQSKDVEDASCWEAAFGNFQREVETCETLDDVSKNLISFSLMKCHLGDRADIFDFCDFDKMLKDYSEGMKSRSEHISAIKKCKSLMPISAAGIQLQFFNHLELICFHFESKAWQQRTEGVVSRLADTSAAVADSLFDIKEKEDHLIRLQETSLLNQEQLLGSAARLQETINEGHNAIEGSLEGIRVDLDQAKSRVQMAFEEVFGMVNRVIEFQSYVSSQIWDFGTFVLYGGLIFVAHYITSAESTKRARGAIFVCLTLMLLVELAVARAVSATAGLSICSRASHILRDLKMMHGEAWDTTGFHGCQKLLQLMIKWWRISCLATTLYIFMRSWWTYRDPATGYTEALQNGFDNIWVHLENLVERKKEPEYEKQPEKVAAILGLQTDDFPDYRSSDDSDWETDTDATYPTPDVVRRNPVRKARPSTFFDLNNGHYNPILHYESPSMFADRVELNALRSKLACRTRCLYEDEVEY